MSDGLGTENGRALLEACSVRFGSSIIDADVVAALVSLRPAWDPAEWVCANEARLRVIVDETSRYALAPVLVVAVLALFEYDRYALRDYWADHRPWDDLFLISSAAGERLPEPLC